jgi:DoxX-like family
MSAGMQPNTTSTTMIWIGRVISALPVLMLIMSGVMKFHLPADAIKEMTNIGWEPNIMPALGIVELGSVLLYVIPQTAVLGAILLTGYLGGAVATHVRVADWSHMPIPIVLGVFVWVGLYLRDARVRLLAPIRNLNV